MVIIQNVSKMYSKAGIQTYELRINNKIIDYFEHRAEDGLAACLLKASRAAEKHDKEKIKK